MKVCKHEAGWVSITNPILFIFPDGEITHGQGNKYTKQKIKVRCNNPDCNAVRNCYLASTLMGLGKIETSPASKDIQNKTQEVRK